MPSEYVQKPDLVPTDQNPFIKDLIYPKDGGKMKTGSKSVSLGGQAPCWVSKKMGLVDKETGEIIDDQVVMRKLETVDKEHFIKVFEAGLSAIFGLSKRAQEVLHYLLTSYNEEALTGTDDDLVYFSFNEAQRVGYPRRRQTWRSGLNELMFQEFMMPATKGADWFWINPTLIYRGNRITIVNQFVKKAEDGTKELEAQQSKKIDPVLDQINMFTGKTVREEIEEQPSKEAK